jgi:Fe(3+) dicitrate transport protein
MRRLLCISPRLTWVLSLLPCVAWAETPPASPEAQTSTGTSTGAQTSTSTGTPFQTVVRAPRALEKVPGSVAQISREDLRQLAPQSVSDALRTVSGIHIVSEDGMGLRVNIGIRGLDPNRSRKVLVLEDGMPTALNPYGVPEMYYTPAIERVESIDIVKGSGQILWGPQTVGGVVNYITPEAPSDFGASAQVRYGSFHYLMAQLAVGGTHGAIAWRVDALHRRFDGPRRLDLTLTDVSAKLRLQLGRGSVLRVKFSFYDEGSRATYLGLTTPQFAQDPTLSLAQHDRFQIQRYALGAIHSLRIGEGLSLQTMLYAYQTGREWRRQEFERRDSGLPYERICDRTGHCGPPGDETIQPDDSGGSIFFRQESAIRNRTYQVGGVEPRLTWQWTAGSVLRGEVTALVRLHYERAREQILQTQFPSASSGEIVDDESRYGIALATAIQSRFSLWDRLHITPGLRVESYLSHRHVLRARGSSEDGSPAVRDVDSQGRSLSYALIPGLGISTRLWRPLTLFAGVHRGYSPPRSKDAVSPSGQNLQLDPELSWNYELGLRVSRQPWLSIEAAGFLIDFENQIIPPSEAAGAVSGGSFNSGRSRHAGIEWQGTFDLLGLLRSRRLSMPLSVSYTFLPLASFVGGLADGGRLPYAPPHLLYAQLRFTHAIGLAAQIGVSFVAAQLADRDGTSFPSTDGLLGEIPSYTTVDARLAYGHGRSGLTFYIAGKNLTGQTYIASRAPAGIQPAGFLQIFGGCEWNWPGPRH